MSPEEEAQLRAQLAAARGEVIDLDEPDITASPTVYDLDEEQGPGGWRGAIVGAYNSLYNPNLGPVEGTYQKPDLDLTQEQLDYWKHKQMQVAPLMGGAWMAGVGASRAMEDSLNARAKAREQDSKEEELKAKEETYRKAMENAKRMAAHKAQQEKVEKDRDESAAEGRGGYRIERALYPSDLHRK